jgi:hypothetical protein
MALGHGLWPELWSGIDDETVGATVFAGALGLGRDRDSLWHRRWGRLLQLCWSWGFVRPGRHAALAVGELAVSVQHYRQYQCGLSPGRGRPHAQYRGGLDLLLARLTLGSVLGITDCAAGGVGALGRGPIARSQIDLTVGWHPRRQAMAVGLHRRGRMGCGRALSTRTCGILPRCCPRSRSS